MRNVKDVPVQYNDPLIQQSRDIDGAIGTLCRHEAVDAVGNAPPVPHTGNHSPRPRRPWSQVRPSRIRNFIDLHSFGQISRMITDYRNRDRSETNPRRIT